MKIEGNIDNQDYVNCFKLTILPQSLKLKLFQYSIFSFIILVSIFFIVFPQGGSRLLVGFVFSYIIISAFILSGRISIKIWTNNFVRFAESNNAGKATYQIVGDSIEFKGSMYECRIPISLVKNILNSNGTYYLKFGNYSGFIVPRLILSGSIEEFIGAIKLNEKFSCEVSK